MNEYTLNTSTLGQAIAECTTEHARLLERKRLATAAARLRKKAKLGSAYRPPGRRSQGLRSLPSELASLVPPVLDIAGGIDVEPAVASAAAYDVTMHLNQLAADSKSDVQQVSVTLFAEPPLDATTL